MLSERVKRILINKKLLTILSVILIVLIFNTNPVLAAEGDDIRAFAQDPAFLAVDKFIKLVILIIRILAVSVCGLMAANAGLKVATEENTDGPKEAKKVAHKILWALFLTFAGTALAQMVARKLLYGLY